jgi:formylglycine-generating enzyme required for sulfatase activity
MVLRVGLDLGASRLKVAVSVDGGVPAPLRFRDGREYLPTLAFVPVAGGAIRVGDRAEDHLLMNGTMIVADVKARLGEETIPVYAPGVPSGGDLLERQVTPEAIITALFGAAMQRLREVHGAEAAEGAEAVVTAPRQALRLGHDAVLVRAAQAVGFRPLAVLEESLAAARWWLGSEAARTATGAASDGLAIVMDVGSWSVDVALVRRRADGDVDAPLPALVQMFELGAGLVDQGLSDLLAERYQAVAGEDEDTDDVLDRVRALQPWLDREGRRLRDAVAQGDTVEPVYLHDRELVVTTVEVEALGRERLVVPLRTALEAYLSEQQRLCEVRNLPEVVPVVLCGGGAATPGLLAALQLLCGAERAVHRLDPPAHAVSLGAVSPLVVPKTARTYIPGEVFRDVDAPWCPEMVVIPAGEFLMGSPHAKAERQDDEGPQHVVRFSRPFALGRYAVTFDEYDRFCSETGHGKPSDHGWGRGTRPVIDVNWEDATAYCAWLSGETGEPYRLPSESEWEYACRAGTTTPFSFGATISTDQANYDGNHAYGSGRQGIYRQKTVPVGSLPKNPWGLHEMHANVWEWVADAWRDSYAGAPEDGSAVGGDSTALRVLRGGSWDNYPGNVRSAYRSRNSPDRRNLGIGFRLARTLSRPGS